LLLAAAISLAVFPTIFMAFEQLSLAQIMQKAESLNQLWLCLVQKKHCAEKRFPVTSNLRYMHGVLNVDEIKKLIVQLGSTLRDERFEPN
jgi:hypothetical protein